MKFHCLFEQSGTFKNEFKKLGYEAYDYDILNDFGKTDYQVDLYHEIEMAYNGKESIFDNISTEDYILAFFPCVRFEDQILMFFRGDSSTQKNYSIERKLEDDLKYHSELNMLYSLITKLAIVCVRGGYKLIIENPYSTQHYLQRYWCLKPKVIDKNRHANGDYYVKPTQYYFINCEPKNNLVMEVQEYVKLQVVEHAKRCGNVSHQKMRSMIHPQYARKFIKEYILDSELENEL